MPSAPFRSLDAAGADLAVGCTYKWVAAGPGAPAFLYVRRDLQDALRQPIWGWFGQRDQFVMGPAYDPEPDIRRFQAGTPPILARAAVTPRSACSPTPASTRCAPRASRYRAVHRHRRRGGLRGGDAAGRGGAAAATSPCASVTRRLSPRSWQPPAWSPMSAAISCGSARAPTTPGQTSNGSGPQYRLRLVHARTVRGRRRTRRSRGRSPSFPRAAGGTPPRRCRCARRAGSSSSTRWSWCWHAPSGRFRNADMAPAVSARLMMAPPCMMPRVVHTSSRQDRVSRTSSRCWPPRRRPAGRDRAWRRASSPSDHSLVHHPSDGGPACTNSIAFRLRFRLTHDAFLAPGVRG